VGFGETHLIPLLDEGLGNCAYLVDLGDGRALAVDVSVDLRAVRATAERRGLVIGFAADTHLHADFVSGAPRPRAGAASSTSRSPTRTRSSWAGSPCGRWPRPAIPTNTCRFCCWTGPGRLGCSPAGR
jgi:hydroxyacylglutathione hydrolase